ncbi:hypothetical protein B7P43_G10960 [Cryptotermes secundus]|uniref:SprT-like domain-containing protein n=1 Tax=Cryptotermes secundus TaxID=105785 RepID=A0A2J7R5L2_9NEOP|nr:uncharacterized protein LOC111863238 isoform X2 [Cryptotermes secundus]PNF36124.1 hypothetical protein B7P43_G10960 [Cryptotermes secundus]
MDLEFSLLTFSPSHVKKNIKLDSAGKGSSKLTLRQRRLYSTKETKVTGACKEKYTSAANVNNMQEKLPKIDFAVGDNVIQPFGILHDKPVVKSRVSKGKENRGTVDLTSDLDRKKQKVAKSEDSVVSSTDSGEFENFLKNVRQEFESTRRDSILGTPDFIDDNVQDNSLGFYLGVLNSKDLKKDHLQLNCKKENSKSLHAVGTCKQLCFSSSDDGDVPATEQNCAGNIDTSKPRTNEKKPNDLKEKNNVKRPQKIIVPPVKQTLVKRTPKTVGQTKVKPFFDRQVSKFCSPVLSFLASLSAGISKGRCHPEAEYYKSNFRMKKKELCNKLFKMYNDKIFDNKLPHDMLVEWNARLKRTAGFCYNRRTVTSPGTKIRTSRIELSTKVCDTADRLRDTLIHELCHAATWIVDDVKDGHGPHWKAWARKAMRVFPELPPIKRCHDYSIQTKFTYRCTGCGYSIGRHSKSLNVATKRCGHCFGMFELLVNTRRKSGTVAQQTLKKRSPVGFARFVKENYSSVKQSRTDLKHGDVMRLLGQQFSAVKIGPEARKQ